MATLFSVLTDISTLSKTDMNILKTHKAIRLRVHFVAVLIFLDSRFNCTHNYIGINHQ